MAPNLDVLTSIAVILATLTGPIIAVWVTRVIDERRSNRARKLEIFRALMRTRRATLTNDYVSALNMIEIDFHDSPAVLSALSELMKHYSSGTVDQIWKEKSGRLSARLLYAIGKNLGYKMEQLDILEGGYMPNWAIQENEEQRDLRLALMNMLGGNRPLPVVLKSDTPTPHFPPPSVPIPPPT